MATILDLTTFDAALKKYYTDEAVRNLAYKNRPFLALCPKKSNVSGKTYEQPITYGTVQGRSTNFTAALNNKASSSHERFSIPSARNYALADIDGLTMQTSMGSRGAFMEAATHEIDSSLKVLSNNLASDLYSDGLGAIGVVASYSDPEITLTDIENIHNFEVGMTIETSLTKAGTVKLATDVVAAVNRTTGVVTLTTGGATVDAGDVIFQIGDATGFPGRESKLVGLDGWLPTTVTDAFFGVTRTSDTVRLGGVKYDANTPNENTEVALIKAGAAVFVEGGSPDHVFVHPTRMAKLDRLLEGRGRYDKVKSVDAAVGFDAITIHTGGGSVQVVADPWCPEDTGYMLQLDTWKLISVGAAPKILTHDGMRVLRNSASDSIEVRSGYYANLSCAAPGWNCRITFDIT